MTDEAPEVVVEEEDAFITDEPLRVGEGEFVAFLPSQYIEAGYSGILVVGGDVYLHNVTDGKLHKQLIVKAPQEPKTSPLRAIGKPE